MALLANECQATATTHELLWEIPGTQSPKILKTQNKGLRKLRNHSKVFFVAHVFHICCLFPSCLPFSLYFLLRWCRACEHDDGLCEPPPKHLIRTPMLFPTLRGQKLCNYSVMGHPPLRNIATWPLSHLAT